MEACVTLPKWCEAKEREEHAPRFWESFYCVSPKQRPASQLAAQVRRDAGYKSDWTTVRDPLDAWMSGCEQVQNSFERSEIVQPWKVKFASKEDKSQPETVSSIGRVFTQLLNWSQAIK